MISSTVTILTSIEFDHKNFIIAILSSIVVIVTSISELMKFKEQWYDYRTTAENIKSEKSIFLTATDPYEDPKTGFHIFVKNYERILSIERIQWKSYISDKS